MSYDIYSTLPDNPTVEQELKDKILRYLQEKPNQWSNVKQICEAVGFEEKDKTKPTIRKACKELLSFQHEPIASCHAGFTYATNKNIMLKFKENMQSRVQGMMRTLNDIDAVLSTESLGEAVLFTKNHCMGVQDQEHLWDKNKDPWVCIRCKCTKKAENI